MIEKAIYSLLASNSAITDLLSSRIYPMVRRQTDELPAITFQIISSPRGYTFDGPMGLVRARVQINCYADDPLEAANISEIVRKSLEGFQGSPEDVRIESMMLEDIGDLPVIDPDNEQLSVYAKTMDFYVLFKE